MTNIDLYRVFPIIQQQIKKLHDLLSRSLQFPASEGSLNATLPTKDQRKGKVVAFDDVNGDLVVVDQHVTTAGELGLGDSATRDVGTESWNVAAGNSVGDLKKYLENSGTTAVNAATVLDLRSPENHLVSIDSLGGGITVSAVLLNRYQTVRLIFSGHTTLRHGTYSYEGTLYTLDMGGSDIVTNYFDTCELVSGPVNTVTCTAYYRANGKPVRFPSTNDLGLGDAATLSVGTTAGTVAAGNHSHVSGTSIAVGTPLDMRTGTATHVHITGSGDVGAFYLNDGQVVILTFDGTVRFHCGYDRYNCAPGSDSSGWVTVVAGDRLTLVGNASQESVCTGFLRWTGKPVVPNSYQEIPDVDDYGGLTVMAMAAPRITSGHRLVWLPALNLVDGSDTDTASLGYAIGMTLNAAIQGDMIRVAISGKISEPSWSFTTGRIYAFEGGAFTQTLPSTGAMICVGRALSNTEMYFQPQPTIILG
ncbi:hypothetical protein CCP3SC1_70069 [Gammaproteobacteria bacterium]